MYNEIVFQDRWIFYKHLLCRDSNAAFTKFNNLEAYTLMYNFNGDILIYATLLQLLEVVAHTEAIRPDAKPCEHRDILAYINQDISLPHTNQSLAKHFFMSESQFRRVFKQLTGSTLTDYLNSKRVNCARQLIRTGTKAKAAAQTVGFNQYISFYNANKKIYVSTPGGEHPTDGNDPLLDNGVYGNTLDVQSYLSR